MHSTSILKIAPSRVHHRIAYVSSGLTAFTYWHHPSTYRECPHLVWHAQSAHAYALRLYRSARDLQLVDSCLLTDEVCGELSHRAREIFADRTAGSAAPNKFGGVGTAEGSACMYHTAQRARENANVAERVSVAAITAARLVCVTLELQAPQQHGEGDRIAVRCRAGAIAVARISSLPPS